MAESWSEDPSLSLFSTENRANVERAFASPSAVIFGWHYFFAGGSSRSMVDFESYDTYHAAVERARPGDHFCLFDLDSLHNVALLHTGDVRSQQSVALDDAGEKILRPILADGRNELAVVGRHQPPGSDVPAAWVEELWDLADSDWDDFRRRCATTPGEVFVFHQDVLDADQAGAPVRSVTATDGRRRVHALVDAKRPDEHGRVPSNGPY